MLEGLYEECSEYKAIHYNPYRHLRFESEQTREMIK